MVDSYEVGKLLSFKCDIDGYFPEPSDPWQCIVDTATNNNTVKWNTTDLPECMGKYKHTAVKTGYFRSNLEGIIPR